MIVKKHWLHGDIKFNVDVQKEDSCGECIHWQVCKRDMEHFCRNYCFGTSERNQPCNGCIHRHVRLVWYPKDGFPCFKCRHFEKDFVNGCLDRPL